MLEAILSLSVLLVGDLPEVEPKDDMVITESVRIKAGEYHIVDKGERGVLHVKGDNVLVLLDGVTIVGAEKDQEPDAYAGTGLVIHGGTGNIVHGGAFRGFKVGMHVDGGRDHWLMETDLSGNYAQRLKSTPEKEDETDWLRPHENDEGEWAAKYGAGVWVKDTRNVRLLGLTGHGSQNGILLDRSAGAMVRGCDFSYNSGWGLALWRSSKNRVESNKFDWCVRGYSHGVYDRGQDSAGILLFEQCNENVICHNSATHSGDGFFLYAGEETLKKTGQGGCNDNVVEWNDFSYAVANGIEATFSTGNRFTGNRLDECRYGIWAGYSRKSTFEKNVIRDSTTAGIAIEHGSENVIRGNLIEGGPLGIRLWWDNDEDLLSSEYAKKNRTDSADTVIEGNVIRGGNTALSIADSKGIRFVGNWVETPKEVASSGDCQGLEVDAAAEEPKLEVETYQDEPGAHRGRRFIIVTEWGPYDFSKPLLNPSRVEGAYRASFTVLGAEGPVRITGLEGEVEAFVRRGLPEGPVVEVSPSAEAKSWVPFTMEVEAGGVKLTGSGHLLNTSWTVRFWQWTKDPRESPEEWKKLLATRPSIQRRVRTLDFAWGSGGPGGTLAPDRFATAAETVLDLPAGTWEFSTISDDGVRLWVDDELLIDDWTHHAPKEDRAAKELPEGQHKIRIEHFEIDGWARLRFNLRKVE